MSLVEYGLLVGLIAIVGVGAVGVLGGETEETFQKVAVAIAADTGVEAPR